MSKRFILALAAVMMFLVGFGSAAEAWPGVADRDRWHGYFRNRFDDFGDEVFPGGFPGWVNNANEFISYIKCRLNGRILQADGTCDAGGNATQNRIGAAFIIDTMISDGAPTSYVRTLPPTAAQVADWEARVRYADSQGWVDWNLRVSYSVNSYYQDSVPGGDVAFYTEPGTSQAIIFRDGSGSARYMIRRECANPLGTVRGLVRASNYEVTPMVVPGSPTAQQGDNVTFTYRVRNAGPTVTQPVSCARVAADRPPGYVPLPQQDVNRAGAVAYGSCPVTIAVGATVQIGIETVTVGNQAPGTKICRSLVINPRNEGGGYRASAEACVTIAKSPFVHFMGNDVWAGGNYPDIVAACTGASRIETVARELPDGSLAGSVSEYGAFALGTMTAFGSASKPHANPAATIGKVFSFANTGASPGSFGATDHCINDYLVRFANVGVSSLPAAIDVAGRGSGVWRINGNHTIRGDMPTGAQQVYIVQDGSVTIDGNIRYAGNYNNLSDIPSLVIIATCTTASHCADIANPRGQIRVNSGVEQMDGLFISKNAFHTCAEVADPLHIGVCNRQLTINGAVIARDIRLRRTYGADGGTPATRKVPAEVFNFTTEMYLRSALQRSGSATVETIDMRELPPRF